MFIILDQVTSFAQDNFFLKNCDCDHLNDKCKD